jgi:hypothetical protein
VHNPPQQSVFALQSERMTLIEEIREAKAQIARLEAWETEKQRYELHDVGEGSLAYVIKESVRGGELTHKICARSYQHGQKSILQPKLLNFVKYLSCPECKTDIRIGFESSSWGIA